MNNNCYTNFLTIYENLNYKENEECFQKLIEALYLYYKQIWENCSTELDSDIFISYNEEQKLLTKNQTDNFLSNFVKLLQLLDKDKYCSNIRKDIRELTYNYMSVSEFFNTKISKDYPLDFLKSTKFFIKSSMKFDTNFNFYDIFQALRNVWTMNLLQSASNMSVKMTYPIFGYSMLYPYTDNLLDSKHITMEEKCFFAERLTRRLKGENIFPLCPYEEKVFELISFIEKTYPRNYHYSLYKSLFYIHISQIHSLKQYSNAEIIEMNKILSLSFKKGGVSVLTDAFLIKGDLDIDEIIFSFGLGIILQLIDDLQDINTDYKLNNKTVFTYINTKSDMDYTTSKLINFIITIIDSSINDNHNFSDNLKKALKQNCILMVLFSISRNTSFYTKEFIQNIQHYYPFPPSYMKNFNAEINRRCSKIKKFKNITAAEIFDILLIKE